METPLLPVLLATSLVASLLYSWMGVAFSLTMIVLVTLIGLDANTMMPSILAAQLTSALATSAHRTRSEQRGRRDAHSIALLTLGSLTAFTAAMFLGVGLRSETRVMASGLLLVASGFSLALLSLTKRSCKGNPRGGEALISVASGVAGGLVKGVVGAGITPVMIALQSLSCRDFGTIVYRTVFSELAILAATLIPYAASFGLEPEATLTAVSGSLLGSAGGAWLGLGKRKSSTRSMLLSGALMLLLGLLGLRFLT